MPLRAHSASPRLATLCLSPTMLLVVLRLLCAAMAYGALACPGDAGCCAQDTECDDTDACTVDRCAPDGCQHAPVDLETVRADVAATLALPACASERLPRPVVAALGRARALVERGARRPGTTAPSPLPAAVARLKAAGRHLDTATVAGQVSSACAAALAPRIETARARVGCLVSGSGSQMPFACLSSSGPLIRLAGEHHTGYSRRTLAAGTRLDARGAVFFASPSNHYPISLDGGRGVCLAGGEVRGRYDRSLGWADMHDMNNAAVAFANPTTVDGIRIDDVTDGIRPRGAGPFAVHAAWLSYIRDDCVENDHVAPGLIDDSLFDGCYVALSERPAPGADVDGRNDLVTIRRSLIRLEPMPGPRDGTPSALGHGEFFKWSDRGTRLALYDDVFMAERVGQGGPDTMGVPDSLTDCARNVMVWLGPGPYPAALPTCFTITRNRTVWDDAVARWKRDHPAVGRL